MKISNEAKLKKHRDIIADPLKLVKRNDNNQLTLSNNTPLRSVKGVIDFENMILQSNENYNMHSAPNLSTHLSKIPFLAIIGGKDYENVILSNIGTDSLQTIQNTSTIDVSIYAQLNSFGQFCAIERPMLTQNQNITYRNLINSDTGETIKYNFGPTPSDSSLLFAKKLNTTQPGVNGTNTLSLGSAIVPLNVQLTIIDTASSEVLLVGSDAHSKGSFTYTITKIAGPNNLVIKYDSGIVTFVGDFSTYTIILNSIASMGDEEGSHTLNVTTEFSNVTMVAEQRRINYKDDSLKQFLYNKNLSDSNLNGDLIADTIKQMNIFFIADMNTRVMEALIEASTTNGLPQKSYNIANYNVGSSFLDTRNDYLGQCIMGVGTDFAYDSDQGATSLFVTPNLVSLLSRIKDGSFIAADTIFKQMDGVIGTLNGMPVIRSRLFKLYEDKITAEALAIEPTDPVSGKPYIKVPFIWNHSLYFLL